MRGLVVDWGSVLTSSIQDSLDAWQAREAIDRDRFATVMRNLHDERDSDLHLLETGILDRPEFDRRLASRLMCVDGSPVDPIGLADRMMSELTPNAPVRSIVRECREAGWRTVMLSNSWGTGYDEEALGTLFDAMLFSDRIGLRKPDRRAFEAALVAIDLPPQACIMIDDLRRNIKAAEEMGMTGFLYRHGDEGALRTALDLT